MVSASPVIAAHFFDGSSGCLHPAHLDVREGIFTVITAGFAQSYPQAEVALSEPFAAAPLMLRFTDGACCEVPDRAAREQLLAALGYRKTRIVRWQEGWRYALLALALLAALLALLYLRGVPALTERIVAGLPSSTEARIGQAILSGLEARGIVSPSQLGDRVAAEVQALLPAVAPADPRLPMRVLLFQSEKIGANALALPDGTVIVTDELLLLALSDNKTLDDEARQRLTAVLAHEAGHVAHRHDARTVASSSLTAALSLAMFGDFSAVAAGVPAVLSQMQYSREMETEADDYALAALRRNSIRPAVFADMLSRLERQRPLDEALLPRWLSESMSYLSTHPATSERIRRLEAAGR